MHFAGPQLISVPTGGAVLALAGLIVGYEGTVASIPALWKLCDGNNGTPNLLDKMVIGADDSTFVYNATGGLSSGQVTGTSASNGSHGNIGGLSSGGGGGTQERGLAGVHSHALTGDLSTAVPPSRRLVYIMASIEAPFPSEAVIWMYDSATPDGFAAFSALQDRFVYATTGDSRITLGSDSRNISLTVGATGGHTHPSGQNASGVPGGGGGSMHPNYTGGNHSHSSFSENGVTVNKPPYLALMAFKATEETGGVPLLVAAYYGSLGALPAGWQRADGTNGTPNMKGRIPIGAGGTYALGTTGGSSAAQAVSGPTAVPSTSATHLHGASPQFSGSAIDHSSFAWTHNHASWSGNIAVMPPYKVLYYVAYIG